MDKTDKAAGPVAPDHLVLGSGGVLGDIWMTGLVLGLARSGVVNPGASGQFVGTSAGSIVATRLAVSQDLEALVRRHVEREIDPPPSQGPTAFERQSSSSQLAGRIFGAHGTGGRLLRRAGLGLLPEGKKKLRYLEAEMASLARQWPDRLNITAVDARTARRVLFNRNQNDGLSVSEAVQASCAIPAVFRPVASANGSGKTYVDGGVWSPVNLDAVPVEPGQTVLCLTPTGSDQGERSLRSKAVSGVFKSIVAREVSNLREEGARVINVVPDESASAAIGPSRMAHGREEPVFAAAIGQGLALAYPLLDWLTEPGP